MKTQPRPPWPPLRRFMGWFCPVCRTTQPGRFPASIFCAGGRYLEQHEVVVMDRLFVDAATGRLT